MCDVRRPLRCGAWWARTISTRTFNEQPSTCLPKGPNTGEHLSDGHRKIHNVLSSGDAQQFLEWLALWKVLRWPYRTKFRVFSGGAQPTALEMLQHPGPWAATNACPGLRLNRRLWYTAWAAVSEGVDAALHQGERPEAESRNMTCRGEWHEYLPDLRRGGWGKPY
jgi:hypothetical protein